MSRLLVLFALASIAILGPSAFAQTGREAAQRIRYDGHRVVRVQVTGSSEVARLREIVEDYWSHGEGPGAVEVRVSPEQFVELRRTGLPFEVMIDDVQVLIDAERARLEHPPEGPGAWFDDYHPHAEVEAYLTTLVTQFPGFASQSVVGTSLQGRSIRALKITNHALPDTRPAFFLHAMQHAREWITTASALYMATDLLEKRALGDPLITDLLDHFTVYVVPCVNPDGYQYTWDTDRLWRKNRRFNGDGTFGVDLNRNWGEHWGGEGASSNPSDETYRGPGPFSEPESTAMRDFILAHPEIVLHIDLHSYSELVMWPYGYDFIAPPEPDKTIEITHALEAVDAILGATANAYTPQALHQLYLAAGNSTDWSYAQGDTFSWTIELRPATAGEGGFILPPTQIVPTGLEVSAAVVRILANQRRGMIFRYPQGLPSVINSDAPHPIAMQIIGLTDGGVVPASATAWYRSDTQQPFSSTPIAWGGLDLYSLSLPAQPCDETIEYFVTAETAEGDESSDPAGAPADVFTTLSVLEDFIFSDDAQTDAGWTISNVSLTDGAWSRGVPAGAGDRGDPVVDFDGSGACWLTDNTPGNSDVDGGPTHATSPVIDLSAADNPLFVAGLWMTNDDADVDRLSVSFSSDNGANWTSAWEANNTGGWVEVTLAISDFITPTATTRIRITCTDNPNNSVTEAAFDAVRVVTHTCPPGIPGDIDGDGLVSFADLLQVLGAWGPCPACAADLDGDGTVGFADVLIVLANWT